MTRLVHFGLYELTGDRKYLEAAYESLQFAIAHAPEQYRESMVENVRVNREIVGAWEDAPVD